MRYQLQCHILLSATYLSYYYNISYHEKHLSLSIRVCNQPRIINVFSSLLLNLVCCFLQHVMVLTLVPLDSMNEIIDKYNTHSKNLGKAEQPSLDLNVCNHSFPYCTARQYMVDPGNSRSNMKICCKVGHFMSKGLGQLKPLLNMHLYWG